ncbi:MAG TPA: cyclohexanecarboxyl-CoA dehydrogenase, partial [Porticoccaceae bacterium]|nr:cyclohexanecarboxyl-CoA dehydrogenase [Porticoccaceae bacterium]
MDYQLSQEQQMLVDMVRRFVREEICPLEEKLDPDAGEIHPQDSERLKEMTRKMGLYGLGIPPEFGGPDVDVTTQTLLAFEMA